MPKMTKRQFEEMFREEILPGLIEHEQQRGSGFPDKPGRREAWNNMVDSYIRDRQLPESAGNWGHPRWLETARGSKAPRLDHAVRTKKSPAQLDREIAEVLRGTSVGDEVYAVSGGRRHGPGTVEEIYDDGTMRVDFTRQLAGRRRVTPQDLIHVPMPHARKKKITAQEARRLLESDGFAFNQDFHQLGSYEVGRLADLAKLTGYRKRKDAPGSTVRMFYQYLGRQRGHATRAATRGNMLTVYDLIEVNKQTKKERVLHEHFSTRGDAKEAQDEYEGYKRPGVTYRIKSRQVPKPPMRWNLED
jgi:hypothetical protein